MLNFIYRLYLSSSKKKFFGQEDFFGRLWAILFRKMAPFYYAVTAPFCISGLSRKTNNQVTIVSLTTFPARIDNVALTIESILRQKEKADKILLWLYAGEFNDKKALPKQLLRLQKRGLEIRFCDENLMPHKKYYYTMLEHPNANVITIDDDMFYPSDLIFKLKTFHLKYPRAILCCITRKIQLKEGVIDSYSKWDYITNNSEPNLTNLTMGGGGTLFPPNSLHENISDIESLKKYALKADDLWLKIMSLKNNTKVVSLAGEYVRFPINVIHENDSKLMHTNIGEGQNDKVFRDLVNLYQIPAAVFKSY